MRCNGMRWKQSNPIQSNPMRAPQRQSTDYNSTFVQQQKQAITKTEGKEGRKEKQTSKQTTNSCFPTTSIAIPANERASGVPYVHARRWALPTQTTPHAHTGMQYCRCTHTCLPACACTDVHLEWIHVVNLEHTYRYMELHDGVATVPSHCTRIIHTTYAASRVY